jgi:uncharacterized membrane protein (DUF4010 family)
VDDFNLFDNPMLLGFAVALGIGLLIGIERERRKGSGPDREAAGIRTFAIVALAGAAAITVGGEVMLAVAVFGVAALIAIAYWRRQNDVGLTTEYALIATVLLGGLAMREPQYAAGIAVVVTVLLAARADIHHFVRNSLSERELRDGLILAAATLVVLPLLPDKPLGPWGALNLRTVWIVVVLVMAIGAVGYIMTRLVGPRYGLPITGLASGFVSSTATIATMGSLARKTPKLMKPAAAGAVLSTVATVLQMAVILAAINMPTLTGMLLPLGAAGAVAVLYGGAVTIWALKEPGSSDSQPGNAFSVTTALAFAGVLTVILVVSAALRHWLGEAGLIVAAAAGGFADAHSASASVASLVAGGQEDSKAAIWAILAAFTTNTLSKMFFAFRNGGGTYALLVAPGLVLVAAAAWAGALVSFMVR